MKGNLLIIEDDEVFCGMLRKFFSEEYAVTAFSDPEQAVAFFRWNPVDVILTDLSMPKIDGIEILRRVKERSPGTDVIVMTAYARVDSAVDAMKRGAYDYIVKPFSLDELSLLMKKLFDKRRLVEENIHLKRLVEAKYRVENIIGNSEAMENVRKFVGRVSQADATVLITGESGTGKHLVARTIHTSGKRRGRGFISVHCGSIPQGMLEIELFGTGRVDATAVPEEGKKGLYEQANGGTLVLSEIGDMDMALQSKLLGVLEDRTMKRIYGREETPLDVMVIATTNKDLDMLRQQGRFRSDLFYRLNMFNLQLPPLRTRKEDIPQLAEHFFGQYREEFEKGAMQLAAGAVEALQNYDWPGNVRELKSFLAKLCLMEDATAITAGRIIESLPKTQGRVMSLMGEGQSLDDIEKELMTETLKKAEGNIATAARMLNVSYDTFRYRMKKFGISRLPYRA